MKPTSFARIYVELTNRCGLACDFCPPGIKPTRTMTPDELTSLAPQLKTYTNEVACHLLGDPLMLENLESYLDIFHTHSLKAQLTSSGFPLQKRTLDFISHPAIHQINISLHAYSGNTPKIPLEEYLRPILTLCDSKRECFVNLRLWVREDEAFNQSVFSHLEHHFDVSIHDNGKFIQLAPYARLHFDSRFEWPSLESNHASDGFCHGLSAQLGIHADGSVVPCCLDKDGIINLGNVFETPLQSIVESARAQKIIKGFQNRKAIEPLCQHCRYKERFST